MTVPGTSNGKGRSGASPMERTKKEVNQMNRKKRFSFWPEVGDERAAVLAARQGFHAAVYCSVVTAAFAILGGFGFRIMGFNLWNLGRRWPHGAARFRDSPNVENSRTGRASVLRCRPNRSVGRVRFPESSSRRNLRFDVPRGSTWHIRLSPFEAAT